MRKNARVYGENYVARPSDYDSETCDLICALIAEGKSIRQICSLDSMPVCSTVFSWLRAHKEFSEQYARAREEQAEAHASEIIDIADAPPITYDAPAPDGSTDKKIDPAGEQWRKSRIDARKWIASKLLPKKYGDKLELDHSGEISIKRVVSDI